MLPYKLSKSIQLHFHLHSWFHSLPHLHPQQAFLYSNYSTAPHASLAISSFPLYLFGIPLTNNPTVPISLVLTSQSILQKYSFHFQQTSHFITSTAWDLFSTALLFTDIPSSPLNHHSKITCFTSLDFYSSFFQDAHLFSFYSYAYSLYFFYKRFYILQYLISIHHYFWEDSSKVLNQKLLLDSFSHQSTFLNLHFLKPYLSFHNRFLVPHT